MQQRNAIMLLAFLTVQCIPDCLRRWPITARHPASITPEPINKPWLLNFLYRILSLFFLKKIKRTMHSTQVKKKYLFEYIAFFLIFDLFHKNGRILFKFKELRIIDLR